MINKERNKIFHAQDTHLEDAGEITCKTNKDSSSCQLRVACKGVGKSVFLVISTIGPDPPPQMRQSVLFWKKKYFWVWIESEKCEMDFILGPSPKYTWSLKCDYYSYS